VTTYVFTESWERERERLNSLERAFDVATREHLLRLGVPLGAHCLEVGAGGGSIVCWMADQAGPGGRVVATDLDLTWLHRLGRDDFEVRQHDIGTEDLEPAAFDVIHTRAVLQHVPGRDAALARLVGALRPGGVLLVEDVDLDAGAVYAREADLPLTRRVITAVRDVVRAAGADTGWATGLPAMLHDAGLTEVGATLTNPYMWGGDERGDVIRITVERVRPQIAELGLLSAVEVEEFLDRTREPGFHWACLPMISAWGRKPR
jgi:SAM-dependent methyltransferase